jgi:hypothetical protein
VQEQVQTQELLRLRQRGLQLRQRQPLVPSALLLSALQLSAQVLRALVWRGDVEQWACLYTSGDMEDNDACTRCNGCNPTLRPWPATVAEIQLQRAYPTPHQVPHASRR